MVQRSFQPPSITLDFMRSLNMAKNNRTRQILTQVMEWAVQVRCCDSHRLIYCKKTTEKLRAYLY